MAKLIQIQALTIPMLGVTGQPIGNVEVLYALDDMGRIWRLDPRDKVPGWKSIAAPPVSAL